MAGIVEKIKGINDLSRSKGCSILQVKEAEKALGLQFPEEYIDYVREFGCIDFGATEWTGLNINGFLNTVTATEKEQKVNASFPIKCFVIEDLNIDAKKVIVDEQGKVFYLQYDKVTPLCNSLSEYLDICVKRNEH